MSAAVWARELASLPSCRGDYIKDNVCNTVRNTVDSRRGWDITQLVMAIENAQLVHDVVRSTRSWEQQEKIKTNKWKKPRTWSKCSNVQKKQVFSHFSAKMKLTENNIICLYWFICFYLLYIAVGYRNLLWQNNKNMEMTTFMNIQNIGISTTNHTIKQQRLFGQNKA